MVTKEVGVTPIFERNRKATAKTVVNVGGAGSSKSHSIAQLFIERLINRKHYTGGICRKTFPSLRMTAMKLIFDILKDYGIYREENHSRSFNTYTHGANSLQFFSLDEPEKIKSANFNDIWMEEANEFTYTDYTVMKLRLREPVEEGETNQMFLSFNPTDAHGWIATRLVHEEGVDVIHSTYLDNSYLSDDYIKTITDLIYQDENFYKIYALGEWGLLQRRIYTNFTAIPLLPDMTGAKWVYGLDFGLVAPSAVIKVYLLGDKFYLEEKLYKTQITNADIIEKFSHWERGDIYADPSAKQMIAEIQQAGYACYEAFKDVKAGLDLCQRQTLAIPESSVNLIKEIQSYQWKEDRDGNVIPEPVKFNDHLMDAMRYAIFGITERYGFATRRPGPIGAIKTLDFPNKENTPDVVKKWIEGK